MRIRSLATSSARVAKTFMGNVASFSRRFNRGMVIIYWGMVSAENVFRGDDIPSTRVLSTSAAYSMTQGWASFSHEGLDLEKTVEAAGRTLIGKQGEDLFLEITVHARM